MPKTYELDLGDYWRIVKRRKVIVLGTFFIITAAVWIHTSRIPPTYKAAASVKVDKPRTAGTTDPTFDVWEGTDFFEAQMEVISTSGGAHEAASALGLIKEGMTEKEVGAIIEPFQGVIPSKRGNTNILDISVTTNDSKQAAMIVNAVAKGYQIWSLKDHNEQAKQVREYVWDLLKENEEKLRLKEVEVREFKEKNPIGASLGTFQSQVVDMEIKLSNLLEKYTDRHPEVTELRGQIENLKVRLAKFPELEMQFNKLTGELQSLNSIYGGLKQKNETIGAVISLILGILLAFVKENVDTSISTIEEVEDFLQVPILGVIPEMVHFTPPEKKWEWRNWLKFLPFKAFQRSGGSDITAIEEVRKLIMLSGEEHQFSSLEAYKTLRTNVNFAVAQKKGQILEITSAGAREGKSLTALNLSLTLAQNGQKTCLVSGDLRRETVSRILGVNKEPGLVEILTKDIP